jgi:peptidoglycan hydrolase-like protein with peptidoglycan-binding domain
MKKKKKGKKGKSSKGEDDYFVSDDSLLRCFDHCLTTADSSYFLLLLSMPMNSWMNYANVIYICNNNNIGITNPVNLTNYDVTKRFTLTIACCGGSNCFLTYVGTNLAVNGFVISIPSSTVTTLKLYDITLNQNNNNVDSGASSSFFKLPRLTGRIRGDYGSLVQYPFSFV